MRASASARRALARTESRESTSKPSSSRSPSLACTVFRGTPRAKIAKSRWSSKIVQGYQCSKRRVSAFGAAQEEGQLSDAPDDDTALDRFLSWAVANGVQGMGGDSAVVGIFCGEEGERGLATLRDIAPDQELLRIPLRIAITDHPDDEESNSILYEGAPWSVRLAARILREKGKGAGSPWKAYLDVLPRHVPSPMTAFEWEEMQEIQYPPALEGVYEADWLADDAYKRCSAESVGHATEEEFRWAMSVVHSRTFGSAAKEGGVGVRMLVPLVDMINHQGDWGGVVNSSPGTPSSSSKATSPEPEVTPLDVAAWELQPPASTASGEWEMLVKAIRPMEAGQEVVMSYGERDNDDFLVHYGFVPEANPHDSVLLFSSAFDAVDWGLSKLLTVQDGAEKAQAMGEEAMAAVSAAEEQQAAGEEAQAAGAGMRALSGGRVDVRLLAAFKSLAQQQQQQQQKQGSGAARSSNPDRVAARLVSTRCWETLGEMATTLEQDLEVLAAGACSHGNVELFRFLSQKHKKEAAAFVAGGGRMPSLSGDDPPLQIAEEKALSPASSVALQFRMYKKLLLWEAMVLLGPPFDNAPTSDADGNSN